VTVAVDPGAMRGESGTTLISRTSFTSFCSFVFAPETSHAACERTLARSAISKPPHGVAFFSLSSPGAGVPEEGGGDAGRSAVAPPPSASPEDDDDSSVLPGESASFLAPPHAARAMSRAKAEQVAYFMGPGTYHRASARCTQASHARVVC